MTLQFDSNTAASALPVYSNSMPPASAITRTQSVPHTCALPLLDWNDFHPDGSEKTLQQLLQHISQQLNCEVHIGRALPSGDVGTLYSSHERKIGEVTPLVLKSCLLDASFASGKFLQASAHEATSGVLENFRLSERCLCVIGLAIPDLRGPSEPSTGLVICLRDALPQDFDLSKQLAQLKAELANWLHAWHACRDWQSTSSLTRFVRSWRGARARSAALGTAVCGLALFAPLPYWPQRECMVEPSARRFVSSPIDGRMLKSLVRPGDVVEVGQVIGRLDDEQLRWELSSAQAEMQQAGKQQDSALAHQEGGKMRLAQLEQQKVSLKIQALQAQLERLELRSPVAGVVLQGEWYRSEGAPVARGDTLFEIAPLENMTVQVHLTTEDLGQIGVGDPATIRIDSAYGNAWHGALSRIDPRATVIDNAIRFVADMEVENRENRLRPGMKGSVRIDAGRRSLGWLVFHRPYTWLMKKFVW